MANNRSIKGSILKNRRFLLGVAVFGACLIYVLSFTSDDVYISNDIQIGSETDVVTPKIEPVGPSLPASLPVSISIPKINMQADFTDPVGVGPGGELAVPEQYDSVAYYKYGPTPGEIGPAVVLGHVDSKEGPAVFYSIGQLEPGDKIFVEREDGTTAVFGVVKLERHQQSDFPTQEVYGDIDHAGLRLITCTGIYDRSVLRYTHNLIVYAKLIEEGEGE